MCSAQQTHKQHVGLPKEIPHMEQTPEKTISVGPNMPSPQSPEKKRIFRFPTTRKGKLSLIVDVVILLIVVVVLSLIELGIFPHRQSGFYCNDPKIAHKFTGDTITMGMLLSGILIIPLIIICAVETRACKHSVSEIVRRLWYWYKEFFLGLTVVVLLTEFAKIIIGEPRPHFLDTCRPDTAFNCTTGVYIPSFRCTNTDIKTWVVTDSSRSFPSGHTSLSIYASLFCIWYMHKNLLDLSCKLLKPFLQTLCLVIATVCSLSRISDNRHHWWDVLSGGVLGSICAIYTVVVFCKNFKPPFLAKPRPSHSTCTLLTDTTNKHATSVVL